MLYPIELRALVMLETTTADTSAYRRDASAEAERNLFVRGESVKLRVRAHHPKKTKPREEKQSLANDARGMGGTRLELVTSTMSTWRSNQLS